MESTLFAGLSDKSPVLDELSVLTPTSAASPVAESVDFASTSGFSDFITTLTGFTSSVSTFASVGSSFTILVDLISAVFAVTVLAATSPPMVTSVFLTSAPALSPVIFCLIFLMPGSLCTSTDATSVSRSSFCLAISSSIIRFSSADLIASSLSRMRDISSFSRTFASRSRVPTSPCAFNVRSTMLSAYVFKFLLISKIFTLLKY